MSTETNTETTQLEALAARVADVCNELIRLTDEAGALRSGWRVPSSLKSARWSAQSALWDINQRVRIEEEARRGIDA